MKRIIRLTESDLHNIVRGSVQRVLKEAQVCELDPRTYASLADKRASQGQNDKAWRAQVAARDAFNKQYGRDNTYFMPDGSYHTNRYGMFGNDYTVSDTEQNVERSPSGREYMYGHEHKMNPHDSTNNYQRWKGYLDGDVKPYTVNGAVINPNDKVARQMAHGNGNYVKGKGWQ